MILFLYFCIFIALYIQFFWLTIFFTERKHPLNKKAKSKFDPAALHAVTIIVPCFNEESTVARTLDSLLEMNYPPDKLKVLAVNDGSTDNTGKILNDYARKSDLITVLEKENEGSKFAVLNYALDFVETEFVSCLDADSFAHKDAMLHIITEFQDDSVMSVIPTMTIHNPRTLFQYAQRVEYEIAILARRIFHFLDAIHVVPGPLSTFRKSIFDKLGKYREAYHTEDCEIAMRMQLNGMKIVHAHDAIVSTEGPKTFMKLHKQRVRWTRGFIGNAWDYREMFFNRKYGEVGFSVIPSGFVRLALYTLVIPFTFWSFIISMYWTAHGLWWSGGATLGVNLVQTIYGMQTFTILVLISWITMMFFIIYGRKTIGKKKFLTMDIPVMVLIYNFVAPLWALESWYRASTGGKMKWR